MKVAGKKRKCGICGKKFNANSHNQRYCSEECRCTARRNKAFEGHTYPRSEQVRRCGNSVCPPLPAAMVRSNLPELCVAERMPNITKDRVETEENGQLAFA